MYAIVDIETTGSYAAANGITEISIQLFDGNTVTGTFETLVNPCQPIPRYIQAMTGITDEMVASAPRFEQVAEKIHELLQDRIFVAHNVNFDYSFVKSHLSAHGYDLHSRKLCTVRLSRKIFPGFPSYSLGNLCHSLNISIIDRHRASGDARATAEVFGLLLKNDKDQQIHKSLQRNSKEQALPPNVPKEDFDRLPYTPGVYYFHNEKGKVVYVGKAKNVRYRVNSHFSNNSDGRQKQNFMRHVYSISFQPCATELMACILESSEIRRLWPIFNYSQKRWEDVYGIFSYEDRNGYLRLGIEKNKKQLIPVHTFHYLVEGHSLLRKMIRDFDLCPKLCFMQKSDEPCDCGGACQGKEEAAIYNARVATAIASFDTKPSFAIVDKGMQPGEQSCVLVIDGKLIGMGYIPAEAQITEAGSLKDFLQPYKENSYIRNLVHSYASKFPAKVTMLEGSFTDRSIESPRWRAFD